MKELLILSGKGGTGKTTIASSLIKLSSARAYADCDVDAPNLHILLSQDKKPTCSDYYGMDKASINQSYCIECGLCMNSCRFDAISFNHIYEIDPYACEGCGLCEYVCPVGAISLKEDLAGKLMLYKDTETFSTAKLKMGSGTSGLLVNQVKKALKNNSNSNFAVIDGSPGIGCPVIASISGADLILIVSEPSISGISDMKRIVETASKQAVRHIVCINKYDLNIRLSKEIENYCREMNITFVGKISYDKSVVSMQNNGQDLLSLDGKVVSEIKELYKNIEKIL